MKGFSVDTFEKQQAIDITVQVESCIAAEGIEDGICLIQVPHTTCGIIVNEHFDASVSKDILDCLDRIAPPDATYSHKEGNAHAHIKSTLVGSTQMLVIEDGQLMLGTWQRILFFEFDGPRQRRVWVKALGHRR